MYSIATRCTSFAAAVSAAALAGTSLAADEAHGVDVSPKVTVAKIPVFLTFPANLPKAFQIEISKKKFKKN